MTGSLLVSFYDDADLLKTMVPLATAHFITRQRQEA